MWKFALYSSVKTSRQSKDAQAATKSPTPGSPRALTPEHSPAYRYNDASLANHSGEQNVNYFSTPSDSESTQRHCLDCLSFKKQKRRSSSRTIKRNDSFLNRFEMYGDGQAALRRHDDEVEPRKSRWWLMNFFKSGVMTHSSLPQYIWLGIMALVVLYNYILIIARVVFPQLQNDYRILWPFLDYTCDALYILDIVVKSRTTYISSEGILIKDGRQMLKHYMSSLDMKLDSLSILPTDFIYLVSPQAYPAMRLNRLFRWNSVIQFFDRTIHTSKHSILFRIVNLTVYIMIIIHWNACFYYAISTDIGHGQDEWVYPNSTAYPNSSLSNKYIYSFYWSTLTLLTIGETPHPVTDPEYIFTIVDFLVGVLIFATIVGNVGSMISNMNQQRGLFNQNIDSVKRYMKIRGVNSNIEKKILRWFDYIWSHQHTLEEENLLVGLPDKLRAQITLRVYRDTLRQVNIFKSCEPGLLMEVVLKLNLQVFCPGDYICRKGDIGREMFIVKSGMLEVINDEGAVLASLCAGAVFGEISILEIPGVSSGNKRIANVLSIGYSECLVLSKNDLSGLLKDYPTAKEQMVKEGLKLLQGNKPESQNSSSSTNPESIGSSLSTNQEGSTSGLSLSSDKQERMDPVPVVEHTQTDIDTVVDQPVTDIVPSGSRHSFTSVRPLSPSTSQLEFKTFLELRIENLLLVVEKAAERITEMTEQIDGEIESLMKRVSMLEEIIT